MSAAEKKKWKKKKKQPDWSQINFINSSWEQIATFCQEKTKALRTRPELGKLHTKMAIMQIYLVNIFRQEWSWVYFL